jgi:hypothetical protein
VIGVRRGVEDGVVVDAGQAGGDFVRRFRHQIDAETVTEIPVGGERELQIRCAATIDDDKFAGLVVVVRCRLGGRYDTQQQRAQCQRRSRYLPHPEWSSDHSCHACQPRCTVAIGKSAVRKILPLQM